MIMLITLIKQITVINNFNFDEKSMIRLKIFNEKTNLYQFFKNRDQIETWKNWRPIWYL